MAETIMSMMPSVHLPSSDDVPVPDEPHVSVDDDATIASATLPIAKIVATPIAPSDSTSARHTPQQGNQENQENLEPSVHTRNASSGTTLSDESNNIMGVLPGPSVMTVEEYLASTARPDDDNANPNTETFKSSKKKKNKSRSDVPAVDDNGEPIPIPVGAPRTSHAIIALHELCQGYELTLPTFTYTDDFDCMWKGEMGFLGRTFKEERLCASKQEVKEKLCAVGIKEVEGLVEKGELVKSGKMRKKKAAGGADGQAQAEGEEPEKDGVNWKGMLLGE